MKSFENELKMKQIDNIRRPYAVRNALSLSFRTMIAEFWVPDPKQDD